MNMKLSSAGIAATSAFFGELIDLFLPGSQSQDIWMALKRAATLAFFTWVVFKVLQELNFIS